jgi:hypothetical protein
MGGQYQKSPGGHLIKKTFDKNKKPKNKHG